MNYRGHRSSLALVMAPFFELKGEGAEHTLYSFLHRAATPAHLTTNAQPILVLGLTALLPNGPELPLSLELKEAEPDRFLHYVLQAPELPPGTELRLRVKDNSEKGRRRWQLQRRWPFIARPFPVAQAALVVLVP